MGQEPAATAAATGRADDPQAAPPEARRRRAGAFVFAFMPGFTSGVFYLPSVDLPLYFGADLKQRPWALGYQLTLSGGLAERYLAGLLTHRHHVTAMRGFGAGHRGLVSVGGGVALLVIKPVIEVEGRVAVRFGRHRRGMFGALVRLGWNVGYRELAPMPQAGLFVGVTTL